MEIQFNIFEALGKLTRTLSINSDGAPWLVALLLIICAALWLVLDIVTTRLFPEMFGGSFMWGRDIPRISLLIVLAGLVMLVLPVGFGRNILTIEGNQLRATFTSPGLILVAIGVIGFVSCKVDFFSWLVRMWTKKQEERRSDGEDKT